MKATFEHKKMQKAALQSMTDTVYKFGCKLIDMDIICANMDPLEAFEVAANIALTELVKQYNNLSEEQLKKVSEEVTERYTKIDYGKKDE